MKENKTKRNTKIQKRKKERKKERKKGKWLTRMKNKEDKEKNIHKEATILLDTMQLM